MSLCRLVVMDFTDCVGRLDEDGQKRYDKADLEFAIAYAQGLQEDGYRIEPFYGFGLEEFIQWCRSQEKETI